MTDPAKWLYPAALAKKIEPGSKYRPSNGTEGMMFEDRFCEICQKDAKYRETLKDGCEIHALALIHGVDEEEYPKEWCHDDAGQPTCSAFEPELP
jgi:hypothetical protein